MTKACHRFDTIKVHYMFRSSRLPIPEGVTPVGCHILIRYTIWGAIQDGTSNSVLNKIKSRQMKIAGGGSAKLKFVENT